MNQAALRTLRYGNNTGMPRADRLPHRRGYRAVPKERSPRGAEAEIANQVERLVHLGNCRGRA